MHRNSLYLAALIAAAAVAHVNPLGAQVSNVARSPELTSDVRVRLTAPTRFVPARRVGSVYAVRNDSVGLRIDGSNDSVMLALSDISKLEMSRGRHRTIGHGLLAGVLIGGGIGVVGGAAMGSARCSSPCINIGPAGGALILGVTGAVVGGVLGAVVGSLHKSERFERVSVISPTAVLQTAAAHAIIAPINGGRAVALGLHF